MALSGAGANFRFGEGERPAGSGMLDFARLAFGRKVRKRRRTA
jgi:hypothetical protein